ncbi:MAG: SDR family oxidoreductase [Chitinivibrionales bacterium]|nr:SDR family oxidoreductase [Chitinivibrionales bacterium]
MAKKVVLFGGSSEVGVGVAEIVSQKGYGLHLVGRNEPGVREIAGRFDGSYSVGDFTDFSTFPRVAEEIEGAVDGLLYCAGTINLKSLHRFSEKDFIEDYTINALGAALAVQSLLPHLGNAADGASVVLFSSIAAKKGFPFHASMSMAKGAVGGLTVALAAELAPRIRVNALAPSLVQTKLAGHILRTDKSKDSIAALHPLKRLGTKEDIAQLAAFLLMPESGWITGQIIGIDGGRSTLETK